ncbi:MAG TPA: VWA domain-containing protein, partial [Thermoanaerobaculia bacterium]
LVDSLPRTDFVRQKTFQQVEDLLAKISRSGDHISIVYWDPRYQRASVVAESADAKEVMAAFRDFVMQVKPDTGSWNEATSAAADVRAYATVERGAAGRSPMNFGAQREASHLIAQEERLSVFHRKTAALERLVNSLGTRPGKKAVIYISDEFRLEGEGPAYTSAKRYIDEITRAANAGGVTFYAVHSAPVADPQDASTEARVEDNPQAIDTEDVLRVSGALQRLTDPTGGLLDLNRNSVATLAPLIAEDLESYYSLAYQAKSDGNDRLRSITVKAKNPAYRVRTRTAVVEKSAATQARETVVSRLFVDDGGGDIKLDVREGEPKRASGNRWLLPIVVKIPVGALQFAEERGNAVAHVGVLIASANGIAEVTPVKEDELRIVDPHDPNGFVTYSCEILGDKRGSKVSIGVVDRRTGAIGVRTIDNRNRFH